MESIQCEHIEGFWLKLQIGRIEHLYFRKLVSESGVKMKDKVLSGITKLE